MSARGWLGRRRATLPVRRYELRWCWRQHGTSITHLDAVDAEDVEDAIALLRERLRRSRPPGTRRSGGEVAVLDAREIGS